MNILFINTFLDFGFVLIFGLLAVTCFFVNLPSRESGLHNYRKSRQILGLAMFIIALYCIIRLFIPQQNEQFTDFWLLVLFTFYFSWLSYSSLLFLIETPRYTTRIFLIDGLIPLVLFLVLGVVGLFVPKSRYVLQLLFGLVYMVKNVWMFHTCTKEYNRCKNEIDNYYDIGPDITWIRILLILSLIMALSAVPAFYMPQKYQIIYFAVPIIYSYLVFKVVNFAAKKIERINRRHLNQEIQTEGGVKREKAKDLESKISPMVEKWIKEKKYCREGINIKDVAAEMGTNQSYLSQYINNHLNTSFQQWLNTLRIEEGKTLLVQNKNMSIEEVGIAVGIPQNYNFSRWFRIVTNMTPYQYRMKNLSENRM